MTPEAQRHLARVDPVMRRLIREAGPCTIRRSHRSPYEALVSAVAHQQLHGKAAETILGRFRELFPHGRFPDPTEVLAVPDEALRGVGFSRAKVAAIRDLTVRALDGSVPTRRALARWSDERIIEQLTACRGVGRWTVEMFLMFTLARPDVLPVDDFGIRTGFRLAYGHSETPSVPILQTFAERWRPYRTTASWYLWRAVDLARKAETTKG